MSQSGDTPQHQGVIDRFVQGLPDSEWFISAKNRVWAEAFRAECEAACPAEPEAEAEAEAAAQARAPQLPDGPPIPAGLDLTEVFAAVPPEHLFDENLREEALYADYVAHTLYVDHARFDPFGQASDDWAPDDWAPDDPAHAGPADERPAGPNPLEGLTPFQRHQAQLVDRVLFLEKVIAWAQASKAEVLAEAWDYTTQTAQTGRAHAGPGHEHDWDDAFAAQQGLVAEMACALRIPNGSASGLFRESRQLVVERPDTLTALRTGDISLRHARRLLDQLDSVPESARDQLETVLLPHAQRLTPTQFDGKARKLRERFHPDSITVRRARCLSDRKVLFFPDKDGMATLWLRGAGDDLQGIYTRVTDAAISLQGPDEPRTLSELRADVAVDLLQQGVTSAGLGAGLTANVNITVPVLTLMGKSEEPGDLEGYGPIDPETARKLAGTATSWLRVLTHPHTGVVLDVSSEPFRVPAALKKYLRLRDGTCRFPGCNRSAGHSDLDHTIDKQFGGPTTATNLHFLSPAHHNLKHFSDWKTVADPDGTLHWTSPAGKHYATDPATRISFPRPPTAPPAVASSQAAAPHQPEFPRDPWNPATWNIDDADPTPF
ncbi:HNH endonuclease signature motif containing protein [Cryobacterium sp. PH31-L1]|uniref:HNH endonuclease signature motif containing protein n=1 Tax=Cryobacterium sp. PH31-L1 TaxID=3046199 RepID=UPI0024BA44DA|nr:HNH endonuclease signature motif containing protein [Cryobacterium sp. PH31-L1]MDJ0376426.1 DUF222 domain-containing protein [Cryobacterium sp. PH31-L1]